MMRLPPFTYLAPVSVADAVKLMADHGPDAMLVAGGTDLYPNMKRRQFEPTVLVGLRGIRELVGIRGDRHRAPRDAAQLSRANPGDLRRAGDEQRVDDTVALVERGAPVRDERVPVERVLGGDELEGCDGDTLAGEPGGRERRGWLWGDVLIGFFAAAAQKCAERDDGRRTTHEVVVF